MLHKFRKLRRTIRCRRKYADRCPHIERHSPRARKEVAVS